MTAWTMIEPLLCRETVGFLRYAYVIGPPCKRQLFLLINTCSAESSWRVVPAAASLQRNDYKEKLVDALTLPVGVNPLDE